MSPPLDQISLARSIHKILQRIDSGQSFVPLHIVALHIAQVCEHNLTEHPDATDWQEWIERKERLDLHIKLRDLSGRINSAVTEVGPGHAFAIIYGWRIARLLDGFAMRREGETDFMRIVTMPGPMP